MNVDQFTLPGLDLQINPNQGEVTEELPEYAITDPERIGEVLNVLVENPYYALDVETTGLDFSREKLHGISFAVENHMWYVFGNALYPMINQLVDLHYHHPKIGVVGHNLKFDLHFLDPLGFRPTNISDTQIAQKLVNENMERGLKALAYSRMGIEGLEEYPDLAKAAAVYYMCPTKKCPNKKEHKHPGQCPICGKKMSTKRKKVSEVSIYDIPLSKLVPYAAKDTRLTYDLWKILRADLKSEGMWDIFFKYEMPFLYVLLDMERNGIYINQDRVSVLEKEILERLEEARATWDKITGGVSHTSTKALPEYLFETLKLPVQGKTDTGKPSVDALTLQRLEALDKSGSVAALRKMREYEKLMSTYIGKFQTLINEDGRMRTNFNQDGARTGRLSSSGNINLQNIPSRTDLGKRIRESFTAADDDHVLLVCDYSQLELRIVTDFSEEPIWWDAFSRPDGDPHQSTSEKVKVARRIAKKINFGNVYGQGPDTLCDSIEEDGNPRPKRSEAKAWLAQFEQEYHVLAAWKQKQMEIARQQGYVTTLLGRKRRIPDINSFDKSLRGTAERQSFNAPVQGSAADVAQLAMLQLGPLSSWYGARMLLQVHDELVFEVPKRAVEEFSPIVQQKMEGVGVELGMRVKLVAEPGVGYSWGEAK